MTAERTGVAPRPKSINSRRIRLRIESANKPRVHELRLAGAAVEYLGRDNRHRAGANIRVVDTAYLKPITLWCSGVFGLDKACDRNSGTQLDRIRGADHLSDRIQYPHLDDTRHYRAACVDVVDSD